MTTARDEERSHDPTWPYEDLEPTREAIASDPSWLCAAGHCTCHADRESTPPEERFCIALCDEAATRMPGARCRVLSQGILLNEDTPYADAAGWITVAARRLPEQVLVEWAPADTPLDPRYPFRKLYYVEPRRAGREEAARRRLHNLGYSGRLELSDNIRAFQRAYAQTATGALDDVEAELTAFHDTGTLPPRGAARPEASWGVERVERVERVAFAEGVADGTPDVPAAGGPPPAPPPAPNPGQASNATVKNRVVVLRWPNPDSELLRDNLGDRSAHTVVVKADGRPLVAPNEPGKAAGDHWEITFEVPEGASQLEVQIDFRPTIGAKPVPGRPPRDIDQPFQPSRPVFEARQRFTVDESSDRAIGLRAVAPVDRLMTVVGQQTGASQPAVEITLLTHFVDATEIFRKYADLTQLYQDTYEVAAPTIDPGGEAWTSLRVLGSTARRSTGESLFWFAYCPAKVRAAGAHQKLDCLLLCRHETLVKLTSARTKGMSMHWINQYLFDRRIARRGYDPDSKQVVTTSLPKIVHVSDLAAFEKRYVLFLRAGFGRAMERNGRNVFLICPIPDKDSTGYMFGPDPSVTVARAIRYLWARGHVAGDPASASPPKPKLMAAGFSSGGNSLFSLLRKMGSELAGVMSMDTIVNEEPGKPTALGKLPEVMSWLDGDPKRRFFLIVGQNGFWSPGAKGPLELFVESEAFKAYAGGTGRPRQLYIFPSEDRRYGFYKPGPPSASNKVGAIWYATMTRRMPATEPVWDLVTRPKGRAVRYTPADEHEAHHGWAFHGGPDDGAERDPDAVDTTDYESFLDRFLDIVP